MTLHPITTQITLFFNTNIFYSKLNWGALYNLDMSSIRHTHLIQNKQFRCHIIDNILFIYCSLMILIYLWRQEELVVILQNMFFCFAFLCWDWNSDKKKVLVTFFPTVGSLTSPFSCWGRWASVLPNKSSPKMHNLCFTWCSVDEYSHDVTVTQTLWLEFTQTGLRHCGLSLLASRCLQLCPFVIKLLNVIMFHSFGECESQTLQLMSGPVLHLECPVMKRSLAITSERLLFHMTDFHNCSKINLWNQRKAAAVAVAEDSGCLSGHVSVRDFLHVWCPVWGWGMTLRVSKYPHHVYMST